MKVRGQHSASWLSRWRQGTCPIHGRGLIDREAAADDDDCVEVECTKEGCTIVVAQWPGKDRWHSVWGLIEGPDEIRQALAKGGDIPAEGHRPGHQARMVRTAWPLGEGEDG